MTREVNCVTQIDAEVVTTITTFIYTVANRPIMNKAGLENPLKHTEEKELPGHRKTRIVLKTIGISTVQTLFILVITSLILDQRANRNFSKNAAQRQISFRLPCDDLSLSASEDLQMIRDVTELSSDVNGRNICELGDVTEVVEKATERIHRTRKALGRSTPQFLACGNPKFAENRSRNAAYFTQPENNQANSTIVRWDQEKHSSFVGDGLVYKHGRIKVNTTSFFYVYCTVTLREGMEPSRDAVRPLPLIHVSIRAQNTVYNHTITKVLLESTYTFCKHHCNETTTLQIGSNVLLDRGNEVFVELSNTDRLVKSRGGNNFGLFIID